MKPFSREDGQESAGLRFRLANLSPAVRWSALALLALTVVVVSWLGVQATTAKSHLEHARTDAQSAKDALLSGKSEDATRWAENAGFHADQAKRATHSLPFTAFAKIPLVGSPARTVQQISDVVEELTDTILLPAAKAGSATSPDQLIDGSRIDLSVLRTAAPQLDKLSEAAAQVDARAKGIVAPAYLPSVSRARVELQNQTSQLARLLGNTAIAARVAPSMMGADGPRTYLIAFQNNAEARGTGGILGAFGIIRFDRGVPIVDTLAPNTELADAVAAIDLGPEFDAQYGFTNPYSDLRNSNLSAHFPYAAQIWKSMWEAKSSEKIDGVLTIDPIALSYLLSALGPVTLPDGEVISGQNVVELTMSTAYARFPPNYTFNRAGTRLLDADVRKQYLQEIAKEVAAKLTQPIRSPRAVLAALGKAATEHHLSVWSAFPAEQEILESTPLASVIPDDPAPYAQVVINNLAGNKMDYYLKREIEYAADGCSSTTRNSTVTVHLTNTASGDPLPEVVGGTPGLAASISLNTIPGTMVTSVRLIATKGAELIGVTSGDDRVPAVTQQERGHPTFEVQVAIPPGRSGDLVFRLTEPTSPGAPRVPVQPLVDHVTPRTSVPVC